MLGVDVSEHNGTIQWRTLRESGIEFAICRSSYGKTKNDLSFLRNVNDAHENGIICGAYHYSYSLTPKDAEKEAINCKSEIANSGILLEMPVFFDMEDADQYKFRSNFNFTRQNITEICKTFLDGLKPLIGGIYASYSWLETWIDWKSLKCPVWCAQWGNQDFLRGYMWQYTDRLQIGGKYFDGNILYDERHKAGLIPAKILLETKE